MVSTNTFPGDNATLSVLIVTSPVPIGKVCNRSPQISANANCSLFSLRTYPGLFYLKGQMPLTSEIIRLLLVIFRGKK